ncbi:MAG: Methionyl-tRNA formyltransferase [Planctomycetes bacterium]|nr:Methionyl-tRNA formyltransferase [Planctomycetota bacterium]
MRDDPPPSAGAAGPAAHPRPVRFALFVNGTTVKAWQARAVRSLLATPGVTCALVVVNDDPPRPSPLLARIGRLVSRTALWTVFLRCVERRSAAHRPTDLSAELAGVPVRRVRVVRKGKWSEHFPDDDVRALREAGVDFALRFAFGILRGDVLSAPRLGVWSFHHGDLFRYRGGPPAFWEIVRGDPATGVTLQRLTETLDAGVVLMQGRFRTIRESYVRNRDQALLGAADWPARTARDVQDGRTAALDAAPAPTGAPIDVAPGNLRMAWTLARLWGAEARAQWASLFRQPIWNVGVIDAPIEDVARAAIAGRALPPVRWMPESACAGFVADPFGARIGGRDAILLEEMDYAKGVAHLAACEVGPDGRTGPLRRVLDVGAHLSYPCVVEGAAEDGGTFVVPESKALGEVALWRMDPATGELRRERALLPGFPGMDATPFRHGGRWWILATDAATSSSSNLHAFHAASILGPWTPHRRNPLKSDCASARPAGTPFLLDGALVRPAQDGSTTYGGAIALCRVDALTPEDFSETVIATIRPDASWPYRDGTHTLSRLGPSRTLIDARRTAFSWPAFRRALRSKLRRVIGAKS